MIVDTRKNKKFVRGLTLVELLVTLGIVTLLAALILPTVKSLLSSRKASQAGLLVRNYLEAARARAIASGREVAVVLERVSSRVYDENGNGVIDLPEIRSAVASETDFTTNYTVYNSCIRMSVAEEQRPSDAQSLGIGETVTESVASPGIPRTFRSIEKVGKVGNYIHIRLRGDLVTTPIIDALVQPLPYNDTRVLSVPLQISFRGAKYPIVSFERGSSVNGITEFRILIPSSTSIELSELTNPPNDLGDGGLYPFNLHLPPRFASFQNLNMPRGTCIDLSLSGFSSNRRIGVLNNAGMATTSAEGDYRLRFSTDWISPITAAAPGFLRPIPAPREVRPIVLVFGSRGTLNRVYANHDMPTTNGRPAHSYKIIDVVDDVFLHIGKIDQVAVDFDGASLPYARNLVDLNSQIVRISASDGSVAVAPTGPIRIPDDTLPTTDASGAVVPPEIDPSWLGAPLTRVSQLGVFVELARRRAIGSTQTAQ